MSESQTSPPAKNRIYYSRSDIERLIAQDMSQPNDDMPDIEWSDDCSAIISVPFLLEPYTP